MTENQSENKADAPKRYHFFLRTFFCVLSLPITGWAALAIYYSNLPGSLIRGICSVAFFIFALSIAFWAPKLKLANEPIFSSVTAHDKRNRGSLGRQRLNFH